MTSSIESGSETASFGPELFEFLAELRAHNDRDWFAANKARYEADVLEPALAFIEDFGYRLQGISPHFRADPRRSGGSLFRIHRDTRSFNSGQVMRIVTEYTDIGAVIGSRRSPGSGTTPAGLSGALAAISRPGLTDRFRMRFGVVLSR